MMKWRSKRRGPILATLALLLTAACATVPTPDPVSADLEPSVLGARRVLLVVAHQDDDAFIVSRIRKHLIAGADVVVVWTASSEPFGVDYAERRIAESHRAADALGIPHSSLYFLRHPDGSTHEHLTQIIDEVMAIIDDFKPEIVYVPAYEMGHIDHDIAHFATVHSVRETGVNCAVLEFPVYSAYQAKWPFPFLMRRYPANLETRVDSLSEQELRFAIEYWDIYESQKSKFGLYMSLISSKRAVLGAEFTRPLPGYDYLARPFEARAAYEKFLEDVDFEDFVAAVRRFEQSTRLQHGAVQ